MSPDLVFGVPSSSAAASPFGAPVEAKLETEAPSAFPAKSALPAAPESSWPFKDVRDVTEAEPSTPGADAISPFSFLKDEPQMAPVPAPASTPPMASEPDLLAVEAPVVKSNPSIRIVPKAANREARSDASSASGSGISKSAIKLMSPGRVPEDQGGAGAGASEGQILLRALLNTADMLDVAGAVDLMATLQGIVAVACLEDGVCVAFAGDGSAAADHFQQQAPKLHHHVQPLVELAGIPDTETFSMNSGQLVVTFSLKSEVTLAVLHDPRRQEPALREKITLLAREISTLHHAGPG